MKNKRLIVPLLFLMLWQAVVAQPRGMSANNSVSDVIAKAKKGDRQAILALGKLGDTSAIPFLISISTSSHDNKRYGSRGGSAQMALAKLGHDKEFEEIIAELESSDFTVQDSALGKLAYVGGKRSVSAVAVLLHNCQWRVEKSSGAPGGKSQDIVYHQPLCAGAVRTLSKIVSDGPTKPKDKPFMRDDEVEQWRQWWKQNEGKYK